MSDNPDGAGECDNLDDALVKVLRQLYAGESPSQDRLLQQLPGLDASVEFLLNRHRDRRIFNHNVNRVLLPDSPLAIEGFEIAGRGDSVMQIGGDFFDFIPMPHDSLLIVCGDVAGMRPKTAIHAIQVRTLLRSLAKVYEDPHVILANANRILFGDASFPDAFVTLSLALLDPVSRTLRTCSAGTEPFVVTRGNASRIGTNYLPLGIDGDSIYDSSASVRLGDDDVFVSFTDGIPESRSPEGDPYGYRRLLDLINSNRSKSSARLIEMLFASVSEFRGGKELDDDLTIVVLKPQNQSGRSRETVPDPRSV